VPSLYLPFSSRAPFILHHWTLALAVEWFKLHTSRLRDWLMHHQVLPKQRLPPAIVVAKGRAKSHPGSS